MSAPTPNSAEYRDRDQIPVRRALISVSDKTGLLELATGLASAGVELVSTGSTAATMRDAGFAVTEVSHVTGFPESLDGRVKTLHPAIHAGVLADLRLERHEKELRELGIDAFELVVVNLYPFRETIARGATDLEAVEQIDIGGPAMVRAAAKNHPNVAIVVSPDRYDDIIAAVRAGGTTLAQRTALAAEAFRHTADYDQAVAGWFEAPGDAEIANTEATDVFPARFAVEGEKAHGLRYGENSHQAAAVYRTANGRGVAQAKQLHGKEMSYNNYVDADAAVRAAFDFAEPAVAIIKHANPCGIAVASPGASDPIADAHRRAHACDPLSAFGGIVAANREVSAEMAATLSEIFTEVILAPSFAAEAIEILKAGKGGKNVRLMQLPEGFARENLEWRQISGGFLVQQPDTFAGDVTASWTLATGEAADDAVLRDLAFAWVACRAVKSNGILLAKNGASVGVGMGQVNRVDSCKLAVERAGDRAAGSVAASDAFFPFEDGPQILIDAGVRAIVQPGGSMRDNLTIEAAEKAGITMYFTGERHFFH